MASLETLLTPLVLLTQENLNGFKAERDHGVYLLYDRTGDVVYVGSSKENNKVSTVKKRLSSYLSDGCHNIGLRNQVIQGNIKFSVYYSEHPRSTEGLLILRYDILAKANGYNKRNEFVNIAREMEREATGGYSYFIKAMLNQLDEDKLSLFEKRGYGDLIKVVRKYRNRTGSLRT